MATYEQNEANNDEYAATLADFEELTKLAEEQDLEIVDEVIENKFQEYVDSFTTLVGEGVNKRFDTDREAIEWLKERKEAK